MSLNKLLWCDTETTGLDDKVNDVVQVACIIVIDGKTVEEFEKFCRPINPDAISDEALEVNGRTREEIMAWPDPEVMKGELVDIFSRYVNRYNKADKFIMAGQNVRFDAEFLGQHFEKCGDPYFFSWIHGAHLDTLNLALLLEIRKKKTLFKDRKLETLAKVMGVKLDNAHDALADIQATREVGQKLWGALFNDQNRNQ